MKNSTFGLASLLFIAAAGATYGFIKERRKRKQIEAKTKYYHITLVGNDDN